MRTYSKSKSKSTLSSNSSIPPQSTGGSSSLIKERPSSSLMKFLSCGLTVSTPSDLELTQSNRSIVAKDESKREL